MLWWTLNAGPSYGPAVVCAEPMSVQDSFFPLKISSFAVVRVEFFLSFDPSPSAVLTACPCPQSAPYQWPALSPPSSPLFPGRLRRAEQPRSLHRGRPCWKVTAITLPYENCLSSPDLRFLFFSPLFVDSRTCSLMPEWLHFLRSFLCSLI